MMENRIKTSAVVGAMFFLLKSTSLLRMPLLLFFLVQRLSLRNLMVWGGVFLTAVTIYVAPWMTQSGMDCFFHGFRRAISVKYSEGSLLAFTVWWAVFKTTGRELYSFTANERTLSILVFGTSALGIFFKWRRTDVRKVWLPVATLYCAISFFLLTGVNFRHLMFATVLLALAAVATPRLRWLAVGLTFIQIVNLLFPQIHGKAYFGSWHLPNVVNQALAWTAVLGLAGLICFLFVHLNKTYHSKRRVS